MTKQIPAHRVPVTVIGLGAMGTALARALVRAGNPTTVWNRTSAKAEPLVAAGATHATTVRDAIAASPLVITCVVDHAALHGLLDPAADELSDRVLINLTSGTPEEAATTADWAGDHGIAYLDGKILAVPSTIGEPEAFLLFSGAPELFAAHEPTLAALGSATHLGADPGLASLYDLALLDVMYGTVTGFLHALAILRAEGIDAETFVPYATDLIVALPGIIEGVATQVQTGDYSGDAPLDMQVAYAQHMIDVSQARGVDPAFPAYLKKLMDGAIAAGHGDDDLGSLVDELATTYTRAQV